MQAHVVPINGNEVWVVELNLPNMKAWIAESSLAKNFIGMAFGPLKFSYYQNVEDFNRRAPAALRSIDLQSDTKQ